MSQKHFKCLVSQVLLLKSESSQMSAPWPRNPHRAVQAPTDMGKSTAVAMSDLLQVCAKILF